MKSILESAIDGAMQGAKAAGVMSLGTVATASSLSYIDKLYDHRASEELFGYGEVTIACMILLYGPPACITLGAAYGAGSAIYHSLQPTMLGVVQGAQKGALYGSLLNSLMAISSISIYFEPKEANDIRHQMVLDRIAQFEPAALLTAPVFGAAAGATVGAVVGAGREMYRAMTRKAVSDAVSKSTDAASNKPGQNSY